MSTAIAKTDSRLRAFREDLAVEYKGFAAVLPEDVTPERFARMCVNAVQAVPALLDCNKASLFLALSNCAALNLEPNSPLHEAAIVPRAGVAVLQPEYRAYVKLAANAGVALHAGTIREGDKISYRYGNGAFFHFEPKPPWENEKAKTVGYYAYADTPNGPVFLVWSKAEVEAHRDRYSDAYQRAEKGRKDSAWHTAPDRMGEKTMIHQLARWLPKEVQRISRVAEAIDTGYRVEPDEGGDFKMIAAEAAATPASPASPAAAPPPAPDPRLKDAEKRLEQKRQQVKKAAEEDRAAEKAKDVTPPPAKSVDDKSVDDKPTAYRVGYREDNTIEVRGGDEPVSILSEPLRANQGKSKDPLTCAWCGEEIAVGEPYYDGKRGCKAHTHCVEPDETEPPDPDELEDGDDPEFGDEEEREPGSDDDLGDEDAQQGMEAPSPKATLSTEQIAALLTTAKVGVGETAFKLKVAHLAPTYTSLDVVPAYEFEKLLGIAMGTAK